MPVLKESYKSILNDLLNKKVDLVAVSKTKPVEEIRELYELGHRDFGENYVQELVEKAAQLPHDIRWHYIGHLQRNKVKYIVPFVYLIHGVDSMKLLKEIHRQGEKAGKKINCLLQVHIAREETKFGLDESEVNEIMHQSAVDPLNHVQVLGLMGMATFTENMDLVRREFRMLNTLFSSLKNKNPDFSILSMGMSSDYRIAVEEGSTMVRIGSLIFGDRN